MRNPIQHATPSMCVNEPSFQLNVSPPHSHHQHEPITPDSSPPISPVRKIPFSTARFEFDSHAIGRRLMEHQGSDAETSSVETQRKRKGARKPRMKRIEIFNEHSDAGQMSFAEMDENDNANADVQAAGKESARHTSERHLTRLRSFWTGTSLNYPFVFKKMYMQLKEQNDDKEYRVRENDLSNKVINFAEQADDT